MYICTYVSPGCVAGQEESSGRENKSCQAQSSHALLAKRHRIDRSVVGALLFHLLAAGRTFFVIPVYASAAMFFFS